ncbi:Apoptosis-inducing factor B [Mycena sanguinolenta]|uniref:Apoptosis-inducing factor B n=1 Tax=Mycena sanguinolenta TaxID=230812 RepID=A0A8H6X5I6_9AGAR|nr:Apoptosis-inducing factor B [Mycena sanguinolenta]
MKLRNRVIRRAGANARFSYYLAASPSAGGRLAGMGGGCDVGPDILRIYILQLRLGRCIRLNFSFILHSFRIRIQIRRWLFSAAAFRCAGASKAAFFLSAWGAARSGPLAFSSLPLPCASMSMVDNVDVSSRELKTVVVLGGSYGGARAAQLIAAGLPDGWRLVLIDRNSHVNHVYILPRLAVLPGHEHKAFIPYTNIFHGAPESSSYGGTKRESIAWLKGKQRVIEDAGSVLVVGGGALGIQFATDIAAIYPGKRVTLLHSRARLLPRFDSAMHSEILQALESANVDVILGERLDLASAPCTATDPTAPDAISCASTSSNTVRTTSGRVISADLVLLCTGQRPNTELLHAMDPSVVDPETKLARVLRTMQLAPLPPSAASPAPSPLATVPEPPSAPSTERELVPEPAPEHAEDLLAAALAQIALLDEEARTHPDDVAIDPVSVHAVHDADALPTPPPTEPPTGPSTPPTHSAQLTESGKTERERETTPYPHIFVIGDAADAFGAIPAGHNAYYQAEVAAKNVLRLIAAASSSSGAPSAGTRAVAEEVEDGDEDEDELERYQPGEPAIKVSLGLRKTVYQVNGLVGVGSEKRDDLNAAAMWSYFGCPVRDGAEDEVEDAGGEEGGMWR